MTTDSLVTGQDTPQAGGTQQSAADTAANNQGAGTPPAGENQNAGNNAPDQNSNANGKQGDEPKAPEAYEFKMPDGIELDKSAADEFSAIAKEFKLTQDQAQKVAEVGAKMVQRQQEAHQANVQSWIEAVKNDKEIGGEKLNENLAIARKTIESFGTPELKDILNMTGLGNHPEIVKMAYKIGKAISEDGFVRGANSKPSSDDPAKKLFPSMN